MVQRDFDRRETVALCIPRMESTCTVNRFGALVVALAVILLLMVMHAHDPLLLTKPIVTRCEMGMVGAFTRCGWYRLLMIGIATHDAFCDAGEILHSDFKKRKENRTKQE